MKKYLFLFLLVPSVAYAQMEEALKESLAANRLYQISLAIILFAAYFFVSSVLLYFFKEDEKTKETAKITIVVSSGLFMAGLFLWFYSK